MADDPVEGDASEARSKLAVLGSPIGHSKSPLLHATAYRVLGLDWDYEAIEVTSDSLATFIAQRGPEWRGLSLTMPLKQTVLPLLASADHVATVTGAANTVLFDGAAVVAGVHESAVSAAPATDGTETVAGANPVGLRGFNTDVAGMVRALAGAGLTSARYVQILGGGATAASALVAAAELGAERVLISARSLGRTVWLEPLAHSLGLMIQIRPIGIADRTLTIPDLVVSTLPGGAPVDVLFTDSTRRRAVLLDVAYDPWPSALATTWSAVGGTVVSGLAMLVHQAVLQVRIFVAGDPLEPLPDEDAVLAAMLEAVGLDAAGRPVA
ncbi:MAG: shikimate dehydrogenase [Microbacteriaceae bacterium]|nr:shikimate dehydrogenase [Microbacteriaceae bacterium]